VRNQQNRDVGQAVLSLLAFGAAHAPHQVPQRYIDKYVPVFEKVGHNPRRADCPQKELGIIPANTDLHLATKASSRGTPFLPLRSGSMFGYQLPCGFLEHCR